MDQREESLLETNLKAKKGKLATGQQISEVREAVESDFHVETKAHKFQLIKEMEKETGAQKEDCPVTKSTFNEVKDFEGKHQDSRRTGTCSSITIKDRPII